MFQIKVKIVQYTWSSPLNDTNQWTIQVWTHPIYVLSKRKWYAGKRKTVIESLINNDCQHVFACMSHPITILLQVTWNLIRVPIHGVIFEFMVLIDVMWPQYENFDSLKKMWLTMRFLHVVFSFYKHSNQNSIIAVYNEPVDNMGGRLF